MPTLSASVSKGKGRAIARFPSTNPDLESPEPHDYLSGESPTTGDLQPSPRLPFRISFRQAWQSYLITAVLALLTLLFGAILALILLANSYAAPALRNINGALSDSGSTAASDNFWKEAIIFHGPDSVRMTGVQRIPNPDGSAERLEMNVTISARVAVDTDFIMGFREESEDDESSWWQKRWKNLGRWGVAKLESATVVVDHIQMFASDATNALEPLVEARLYSPISVPLLPGVSPRQHPSPLSLQSLSLPISIYPSQNSTLLLDFLKKSWSQGFFSVRIRGSDLTVSGGKINGHPPKLWELNRWRDWLVLQKPDVRVRLSLPIPPLQIPPLPPSQPGSDLPNLADLLILESFSITSTPSLPSPLFPLPSNGYSDDKETIKIGQSVLTHESPSHFLTPKARNLLINARASLPHPFKSLGPKIGLGKGLPPLPFTVSLPVPSREGRERDDNSSSPDIIPVVKVCTSPEFNETHIVIPLWGYVLPLSNSSDLPDAISAFVSSYLSFLPSPVSIATPLYPSLSINANFPPPQYPLKLLRDVSIENMSIRPGSIIDALDENFGLFDVLASGTVHARVVLPRGFNMDLQVMRVWVDCLVYDGEITAESGAEENLLGQSGSASYSSAWDEIGTEPPVPEPFPLPDPLPPRAFGRITPRAWLNATSSLMPHSNLVTSPEEGASVYVTAQVVDVPLKVLPGRQGDLSRFITKVLFSSNPVAAGLRGFVAVGVSIPGLTTRTRSDPESPVTKPRIEGNELILNGLPFEGNVLVRERRF